MTKDEALKALEKYGSQEKAAKALGMARTTFQQALKGAALPPKPGSGKSLDEFRAKHDKSYIIPQRIESALSALGEGWEYEAQFAKIAGVSLVDLSVCRDNYSDHIVVLNRDGRRAWAGTPGVAKKMREMVGAV
jgi:hypothetical protein